jgi:hypothetical protein
VRITTADGFEMLTRPDLSGRSRVCRLTTAQFRRKDVTGSSTVWTTTRTPERSLPKDAVFHVDDPDDLRPRRSRKAVADKQKDAALPEA